MKTIKIYENGYYPKIQYWNEQFSIKINEGKLDDAQHCLNKMNYFIIRQKELNDKIDIFEVNKKLITHFKHIFELQNYEQ